jgi:alkanesulfonate monooxygenase SsuD/methylene tetrahydromethanopterin reductase-like flavin-dependent oxidoreductase (luciferase family)
LANLKFGCQLPQDTSDIDEVLGVARLCEELGYDSVWVYDHVSPYWLKSKSCLEAWSLLSAVATQTSRIKIGSLVTNVNLRNPGLLAKITSTVDNISNGRLVVGLGIGDRMSVDELRSFGYRYPPLKERITLLRETIKVLRALWTEDVVSFEGELVKIANAVCYPKPKQSHGPQIWVGGKHPAVLDVVAEMADGWNYWGLNRQTLADRERHLNSECIRLRRDRNQIVESWAGTMPPPSHNHVEAVKTRLVAQTSETTDYFIVSFPPRTDRKAYQCLAEAVQSLGRSRLD